VEVIVEREMPEYDENRVRAILGTTICGARRSASTTAAVLSIEPFMESLFGRNVVANRGVSHQRNLHHIARRRARDTTCLTAR
jgi:hypothetical protein